jgi:hypothetical protein
MAEVRLKLFIGCADKEAVKQDAFWLAFSLAQDLPGPAFANGRLPIDRNLEF